MLPSLRRKLTRKSKCSNCNVPAKSPLDDRMDGPPPPYTPEATSDSRGIAVPAPSQRQQMPQRPESPADDQYAFLSTFDTIFLIDDSGSMAGSRWREASKAISSIAPRCVAHDADGIDMYFLNTPEQPSHSNVTSSAAVQDIFRSVRPRGHTPTGQRLDSILRKYTARCEEAISISGEHHVWEPSCPAYVRPLNIICITDGEATDDVEAAIVRAAKALDRLDAPAWQCGIQFFQIGNDPHATRYLQELDDDLASVADMRDMVDTVPYRDSEGDVLSADGILKVVLGAVNRRLDRRVERAYGRR